jgi:gamma-glutamylcyclotransferase (GGCT)/AIG2-like uncharacterized protein YtfP
MTRLITPFMLAYGANTHLPYMTKRCPESYYLGTAKLKEYQMVFRVHADIELCFDSEVTGALWRVSENDLDTLDALEGVPIYYIRHMVWVRPNNNIIPAKELYPNGMIKCWVYQMVQKIGHYHPTEEYLDHCTTGYRYSGIDNVQIDNALELLYG